MKILVTKYFLFSMLLVLINCSYSKPGDKIEPIIYSYMDKSGNLEFADIQKFGEDKWVLEETSSPTFGITLNTIWLKVIIPKTTESNKLAYLEIAYPQLDQVEMYTVDIDNQISTQTAGDSQSFHLRTMLTSTFIFGLEKSIHSTYFIKAKSKGAMLIPIILHSSRKLLEKLQSRLIFHGIYFGFLLFISLYNLLLYFSIKDSSFGVYSLYAFFVFVGAVSLEGYGYQFVWTSYPDWNNISFVFFSFLVNILALEFTTRFLNLKGFNKTTLRLLQLLLVVFIALLLFGYYYAASRFGNYLVLINSLFILFIAVKSTMNGNRSARFFLLAWIFLLTGIIVASLRFLGFVPDNIYTKKYLYIGSALEVLLLSLGLGDRFNQQKKDSLNQQIELTNSYARFVPKQFLTYLNKERITDVRLGDSIQKEMTVLFSDVRSFTTLSETMSPQENFDFINALLKRIGPVIRKHGGFIDKYIGDAIMALFPGTPEDAIRASIEIRQLLEVYNVRRMANSMAEIRIGIGIHSGSLMLGTIGEDERMEGTVISDTVNLAARLEGLSKYYGVTTIVSEKTLFNQANPENCNYRIIDHVKVKGKGDSVSVIEILDGDPTEQLQLKLVTRAKFERAMQDYQNRDFDQALIRFTEVLQVNPDDSVAKIYQIRINNFRNHGLPPDWDGIQVMDSK